MHDRDGHPQCAFRLRAEKASPAGINPIPCIVVSFTALLFAQANNRVQMFLGRNGHKEHYRQQPHKETFNL